MLMGKWLTNILLPLLFLAIVAAYFEFDSVKTVELDSGFSAPHSDHQSVSSPDMKIAKVKSRLAIGERYVSLGELVADQRADGYVKTGHFGGNWPATVTDITSDNDGITFVKRDGTKHNYTGFDGYRMKVVRLRAGERETIIVFRSEEKR